ncbi:MULTISPECIES: hypothetical protein [Cyanophyceae]|uniref:hypothetical protein n=1 Tax=Cyanophyceae TaxID=3028117 RepID=UPI001682DED9|nr:hypothetical protein [Trichocoleus sp. FACHB-40]MBD2005368.1 hypothetical protein [Trichocoleus sp. FACHB-40]
MSSQERSANFCCVGEKRDLGDLGDKEDKSKIQNCDLLGWGSKGAAYNLGEKALVSNPKSPPCGMPIHACDRKL